MHIVHQVKFVGVQLVIRSILKFFPSKNYEILLNTAVLTRNLLDPPKFQKNDINITTNAVEIKHLLDSEMRDEISV